jgi:hypothetical protein
VTRFKVILGNFVIFCLAPINQTHLEKAGLRPHREAVKRQSPIAPRKAFYKHPHQLPRIAENQKNNSASKIGTTREPVPDSQSLCKAQNS